MIKGEFNVIESFAIRSRQEFYMIGSLIDGIIENGWYANIALNKGLSLTLKISKIEEVEMSGGGEKYLLITVDAIDDFTLNLALGLRISLENILITENGKD